jgi:hypothetical protein
VNFSTAQILALAPDASSAKSGQGLAAARHWVTLGSDEKSVWGECQGSGKNPYQTQIDRSEPAFKCSCPSRKFPCKHGLGLFLLFAAQAEQFQKNPPPQWVSDWLDSRSKRAEQQAEKQIKKSEEIADPQAQEKRTANREAKVVAGISELELWMRDLIRNGLAAAQNQTNNFWENPAKRMIDAQAPGLARIVREMRGDIVLGERGYTQLLQKLGELHLLIEGFKRLDSLPETTQADIRTQIGFTQNQDELLKQNGVKDQWFVLGQRLTEEDRIRVQATWLRGITSERDALILHFAHASQPLDVSWVTGSAVEAELVFFPSAVPLRALVKERFETTAEAPKTFATIAIATENYAAAFAANPWLERFPFALGNVIPIRVSETQWIIRDEANHVLPLTPNFSKPWELLALSGGHPVQLFGEWDGENLLPLSVWATGKIVRL